MNRTGAYAGSIFILLGLAIFGWKAFLLDLPVVPEGAEGLWRVELEIDVRGAGRRGSIRSALPISHPGQAIFDEMLISDGLLFTIRDEQGNRIGLWSGTLRRIHHLTHGFRVQLSPVEPPEHIADQEVPPADVAKRFGGPDSHYPSTTPEIQSAIEMIHAGPKVDLPGRLRAIFAFVSDEIITAPRGSDDALLTLTQREGSALGKTRLLVTLLRASQIPARVATGLHLRPGTASEVLWAQAWVAGAWRPLSATEGFFLRRPDGYVLVSTGDDLLVEGRGVQAMGYRFRALREQLAPHEIGALMVPPVPALESLSLYRLPIQEQHALRLILLIPLGTLIIALFRNVVGIRSFGTFMPLLLALALRTTGLGPGLAMLGGVVAIGVIERRALDRLRLLMVPRLCILLCLVIFAVAGFALLGRGFQARDLFAGVLFPIVILTMLIERFSITAAEEGLPEAIKRLGYSGVIAFSCYPIFHSAFLGHLFFGFPELILVIVGSLVWIGSYTGYRVLELVRFRSVAHAVEARRP